MNILIFNKKRETKRLYFILPAACCLLLTCYLLLATVVYAELLDRVVAIVNEEAVMLSELNEEFRKAGNYRKDVTQSEVLDALINRNLLLEQAKKFIPAAQTKKDDNALIDEYIEKKLRVFIRIPFEEVESFYLSNKSSFGNKDFFDVRDDIEKYLIEKELNRRLIEHIQELREKAYIRIQLAD